RRNVGIECRAHRDRLASASVLDRRDEELRVTPVAPGIPVTHEDAVERHAGLGRLRRLLQSIARTAQGVAVGEDLQGERDPSLYGRDAQRPQVQRQVRYLLGFAASIRDALDLRRAAA